MQRFKSPEQAQDFLSSHAFIHGHFHPPRHLLAADAYRALRSVAFDVWHHETRDMTRSGEPFWAPARPSEVNVTMPCRGSAAAGQVHELAEGSECESAQISAVRLNL